MKSWILSGAIEQRAYSEDWHLDPGGHEKNGETLAADKLLTIMRRNNMQEHCDLCGDEYKGQPYAKYSNYQILVCQRCGLLWSYSPQYHPPKKKASSSYWGEEIYLSTADAKKDRLRKQLKVFLERANISDLRAIRLLEVGSGLGFFLDVCEELGIEAEGCDISEKAIRYANRERERVRLGTLDDYYENDSFDAVFSFNVIGHLDHPKDFFDNARRVLKPGGMLILETPVKESLFHTLAKVVHFISRDRLNLLAIGPGVYIYKFSKKTFKVICGDTGFQNRYQRNITSPFGEIWGKSSIVSFNHRFIYRLSLPIAWAMAKIMRQGNRVFVLLQKLEDTQKFASRLG